MYIVQLYRVDHLGNLASFWLLGRSSPQDRAISNVLNTYAVNRKENTVHLNVRRLGFRT